MPAPSRSPDRLGRLAAALHARDAAAVGLEAAAPRACAEHGGADAILDRLGGRMIQCSWFAPDFTSDDGTALWEAVAREQQAPFRESPAVSRPIDPEVEARIEADFAAKAGPFKWAVLAAYQLSAHYGLHCEAAAKTLDRLAARKVQAALILWIMDPAHRSKKPQEALALHLAKAPATLHDEAALEVLNRPLSRFQVAGGSAETEALVLADFRDRAGPFARPVLTYDDLIEHYGPDHFGTRRLAWTALAQVSFRALNARAQ